MEINQKIEYSDFKYKCKKCGFVNTIAYKDFIDVAEKLADSCKKCKNRIIVNAKEVREKKYNNFIEKTMLVSTSEVVVFKISVQINLIKKDFEIDNKTKFIQVGRGNAFAFENKVINDEHFLLINLPDKFVSRRHILIQIIKINDSLSLQLTDEKSLNGTFINKVKLSADDIVLLQIGDVIQIGETIITVTN